MKEQEIINKLIKSIIENNKTEEEALWLKLWEEKISDDRVWFALEEKILALYKEGAKTGKVDLLEKAKSLSNEYKEKLNSCAQEEVFPLHISAMVAQRSSIEWCLRNGYDVDEKDEMGRTALHHLFDNFSYATNHSFTLKDGSSLANQEGCQVTNQTVMAYARKKHELIENYHLADSVKKTERIEECMNTLLSAGANCSIKDNLGLTALSILGLSHAPQIQPEITTLVECAKSLVLHGAPTVINFTNGFETKTLYISALPHLQSWFTQYFDPRDKTRKNEEVLRFLPECLQRTRKENYSSLSKLENYIKALEARLNQVEGKLSASESQEPAAVEAENFDTSLSNSSSGFYRNPPAKRARK